MIVSLIRVRVRIRINKNKVRSCFFDTVGWLVGLPVGA